LPGDGDIAFSLGAINGADYRSCVEHRDYGGAFNEPRMNGFAFNEPDRMESQCMWSILWRPVYSRSTVEIELVCTTSDV
jgi:hypothetical protein